jgi:hypothetical protein
MKKKYFKLSAFAFLLVIVVLLVYKLSGAKYNNYMPQQKNISDACDFNMLNAVAGLKPENVEASFPFGKYLDSANYNSIVCIKKDLKQLDSATHDRMLSQKILSDALTSKLSARISSQFVKYAPDSLIYLMQWAEKFQFYADADDENSILYRSIFYHWFSFIGDKLTEYSKEKPSIKYDFKFKYLLARCNEKKVSPSVKITSFEKVIDNVVQSKWGHLFDASWNQASWLQKVGVLLLAFLFLYGIYCIIYKHFLQWRKN